MAPTSTLTPSWSNFYTPTPQADQQDPIQSHMPGATGGAVPKGYTEAAQAVYPVFDGLTNVLPDRPSDVASFSQWHSAHQIEFLAANGGAVYEDAGSGMSYMLSESGTEVINLSSLDLSKLAQLSVEDQQKLVDSGGPAWTRIQERLDVSDNTAPLTASGASDDLFTALTTQINAQTLMDAEDRAIFTDQIEIMRTRFETSPIVKRSAYQEALGELTKRFDRVSLMLTQLKASRDAGEDDSALAHSDGFRHGAISSDNGATVEKGITNLMASERRIAVAARSRDAITAKELFRDPKIDVPNLIHALQSQYEQLADAEADIGTEELTQLHKLLRDYGVMQSLIQDTLKKFKGEQGGDDAENKAFLNANSQRIQDLVRDDFLTESQAAIFSMFCEDRRRGGRKDRLFEVVEHPIEKLYGIDRPQNLFGQDPGDTDLREFTKNAWDSFATQLADGVTQLNQKNQITQSEIDTATKRRNRHFELGNNALRKMHDMLTSIGRI